MRKNLSVNNAYSNISADEKTIRYLAEFETLDVRRAAQLLHVHPVTLYRLAERGFIPAAKPGKKWVFIAVDLIEWLRSHYQSQASTSDSVERSYSCHSSNAKIHHTGGSKSPATDDRYSKALGLPTERKHRNTTTS
jgi:excisionase family DNA binding protein